MAYALDFCDAPITCHAWNKDCKRVAICENTPELKIYEINGKNFELPWTLSEHTQVISSVDWSPVTNRIVTCSHDRNAYVWELEADETSWKKELVILKLNRAATYVRWSPDGNKFAVATGSNKIRYCVWDENQKWWQSYSHSTNKPTSLNVEWMPNSMHLFGCTTERHMRYFTCDDNEATVKKTKSKTDGKEKKKLVYELARWPAQGWVNCCTVSPGGTWLAMSSQDSYIRFIKAEDVGKKDEECTKYDLNINGLPLLSIVFLSETSLVGGGFDCQPRLFCFDGSKWEDLGLIDLPEIREASGQTQGGGLAAKAAMFGGKQAVKVESLHSNVILGLRRTQNGFSTCSNDGRLGIWPLDKIKAHFSGKNL